MLAQNYTQSSGDKTYVIPVSPALLQTTTPLRRRRSTQVTIADDVLESVTTRPVTPAFSIVPLHAVGFVEVVPRA